MLLGSAESEDPRLISLFYFRTKPKLCVGLYIQYLNVTDGPLAVAVPRSAYSIAR